MQLAPLQNNPESGISSNVYICSLGLLTAVWSLVGYDSTAHMIEETKQADTTAGWPMLYAIGLAAVSGLPFLLALTLCLQVVLHSVIADQRSACCATQTPLALYSCAICTYALQKCPQAVLKIW